VILPAVAQGGSPGDIRRRVDRYLSIGTGRGLPDSPMRRVQPLAEHAHLAREEHGLSLSEEIASAFDVSEEVIELLALKCAERRREQSPFPPAAADRALALVAQAELLAAEESACLHARLEDLVAAYRARALELQAAFVRNMEALSEDLSAEVAAARDSCGYELERRLRQAVDHPDPFQAAGPRAASHADV